MTNPTTTRSRGVDVSIFILVLVGALLFTWGFALAKLGEPASPVHIPWPVFAAGFVLGHFAGIRISFRSSTHRFDLTDVVFLPAAAFSAPRDVVIAAALGTIVRSAYLRRPMQ